MATTPFDARQAIEEARSTDLPTDWHKYPTHRGLVLTRTITAGVSSLLTFAIAILFLAFSRYVTNEMYEIIAVILFLALALWLALIAFQGIQILRNIEQRFFLITPAGFAQVKGSKVVGFPLTDLTRVRLVRDLYGVSLLLTLRSGEVVRVSGLRDYGQPGEIGREMIAACSAIYEPQSKADAADDRPSRNGATPKKR